MTYQQRVRVETNEQVINKMDMTKQTVVFYLAEEAVNNARKHANAKLILVRLIANAEDAEIAVLEIIDNGIGFNASEIEEDYSHRSSFGMINLKERTELINGLLNVEFCTREGNADTGFYPAKYFGCRPITTRIGKHAIIRSHFPLQSKHAFDRKYLFY